MNNPRTNNPVWGVYNLFRTARLNSKFYTHEFNRLKNLNFRMEILIAVSTSSSAATVWLFSTALGEIVWQTLGSIAALLAIIKPFLKLTDRASRMEAAHTGYRLLDYDLGVISEEIRQKGTYADDIRENFRNAQARARELVSKSPDQKPKRSLIKRFEEEVKSELPMEKFYVPEENRNDPNDAGRNA